jgi:hypothetical protein
LYPGLRALGALGWLRKTAADGAADGRPAAKKTTRAGVIAFNALALAGFAAPSLLVFASAGPSVAGNPVWAGLSLASMLAGYASMFASMLRLSHSGRPDLHFGTLFILGLTLVAAPVAAIVAVGPFG